MLKHCFCFLFQDDQTFQWVLLLIHNLFLLKTTVPFVLRFFKSLESALKKWYQIISTSHLIKLFFFGFNFLQYVRAMNLESMILKITALACIRTIIIIIILIVTKNSYCIGTLCLHRLSLWNQVVKFYVFTVGKMQVSYLRFLELLTRYRIILSFQNLTTMCCKAGQSKLWFFWDQILSEFIISCKRL